MAALEKEVRSIEMPGLVWGASKLVPIGYGIKKLQITIVVGEWPEVYIILCALTMAHRGRACLP